MWVELLGDTFWKCENYEQINWFNFVFLFLLFWLFEKKKKRTQQMNLGVRKNKYAACVGNERGKCGRVKIVCFFFGNVCYTGRRIRAFWGILNAPVVLRCMLKLFRAWEMHTDLNNLAANEGNAMAWNMICGLISNFKTKSTVYESRNVFSSNNLIFKAKISQFLNVLTWSKNNYLNFCTFSSSCNFVDSQITFICLLDVVFHLV